MAELLKSQHSYIKNLLIKMQRTVSAFPGPRGGSYNIFFLDGVDFKMSKISFVKVKFPVINMLMELAFL